MRTSQQVADIEDVGIGIGREVPDFEIGDPVVGRRGEAVGIEVEVIVPGSTGQDVVTEPTRQRIVACAANQSVIPRIAIERTVARTTGQAVVAGAAGQCPVTAEGEIGRSILAQGDIEVAARRITIAILQGELHLERVGVRVRIHRRRQREAAVALDHERAASRPQGDRMLGHRTAEGIGFTGINDPVTIGVVVDRDELRRTEAIGTRGAVNQQVSAHWRKHTSQQRIERRGQ